MRRMLAFSILGAAIAVPAAADRGDDDLQVVRKAVASASVPASAQEKARPPPRKSRCRPRRAAR
jgi:hypothetical protein